MKPKTINGEHHDPILLCEMHATESQPLDEIDRCLESFFWNTPEGKWLAEHCADVEFEDLNDKSTSTRTYRMYGYLTEKQQTIYYLTFNNTDVFHFIV